MKKPVLIIIGAIVVIAVVVGIVAASGGSKKSTTTTVTKTTTVKTASYTAKNACDVLTPAIATQVAGAGATSSTQTPDTKANGVNVSTCSYYDSSSKQSVALLIRSALTKDAAATNTAQFADLPDGAQKVSGLGDAAYWSPSLGQLNILKSNNWNILSAGPLVPANRTLAQTQAYADLIINKL